MYYIEQLANIPVSDVAEDHVKAIKVIPGCVFAYARRSAAGDGPADTVVSIHEVDSPSIQPRARQRRAYL